MRIISIGDAVIELKLLDDEALFKSEHQARIAAFFTRFQPGRPAVIVDPRLLPPGARRDHASILERPVQEAVAKARKQLKQSRNGIPGITTTILFVINNGFAALTHEELVRHVERRAQNDTREIDCIEGRLVWDVGEIAAAFRALPHRAEAAHLASEEGNPWNDA